MKKINIYTDGFDGARKRSLERATKLDRGERLDPEKSLTFESSADMVKIFTEARLRLFSKLRKKELSISDLVMSLNRPRTAVLRDVKVLVNAGIVKTRRVTNPEGHGVMTMVSPIAER